jgi:hypothetical protein
LLEQAQELERSFEFPAPNIAVATDQYIAALNDSDLFNHVLAINDFGRELGGLELSDKAAIGGATRRRIEAFIASLTELREQTSRIAWFAPPGVLDELRAQMVDSGRYGARIAVAMLRIVTALSLDEAQAAAGDWQGLLSGFSYEDRFEDLFETAVEHYGGVDLNGRLELALGLNGWFLDDLGMVDPARIFVEAGAAGGDAIGRLVVGAGRFFSHLLDTRADDLGPESAGLALTAVALAIADRPFTGHRIARHGRELIARAEAVNPLDTRQVVADVEEMGARTFAAALRIQREVRLLATGQVDGVEDVVVGLVKSYKALAESAFRTLANAIVRLHDLEKGRIASSERLMLGTLVDRLAAVEDPVGSLVADSVDARLRNAEAHEEYRVESDGTIVFFDDGERLSPDELENRFERLTVAAAGLEAAITCFGVDRGLYDVAPAWIRRGDIPAASELLTRALFGVFGIEVLSVSRNQDVVEVAVVDEGVDLVRLLSPIVAIYQLYGDVQTFRVVDSQGDRLIGCPSTPLTAYAAASDGTKDLASLVPIYAVRIELGHSSSEAFVDTLASMLILIVMTDVAALNAAEPLAPQMQRLVERLAFVSRFAESQGSSGGKKSAKPLEAVRLARAAALAASRNVPGALDRLLRQLSRIQNWVANRNPKWPPFWSSR